ncbi:PAQR family membrane homeostasis protein TrhA [Roseicella aerolata]|uniref:Hemolysin III family protein n=1 Tax=Roseicella aerolata TaxID=2883479 RepID=A0A9X1LB43_9PROT|nr:hemolysin III family protein [Roseicella aerolata]MCB4825459.1 hemolysin III family protein [Roseicella aerolata]
MHRGIWPAYRDSRGERIADAVVHVAGIMAALVACAVLALTVPWNAGIGPPVALGLYAAGLLAMLGCSALYNLAGEGRRRALLRRLDHSAIFVMIAGTYTPVAGIGIGGAWGWGLLGTVWAGAAGGAALKLLAPARFERASILAYLALGWVGVVALDPLLAALSTRDLMLLAGGGLLYSLGVVVHLATGLRYHNALWHALVVAAAACHYAVVLHLAQAAA